MLLGTLNGWERNALYAELVPVSGLQGKAFEINVSIGALQVAQRTQNAVTNQGERKCDFVRRGGGGLWGYLPKLYSKSRKNLIRGSPDGEPGDGQADEPERVLFSIRASRKFTPSL